MEYLSKGAEANICLEGERIIKERIAKAYRIPELDMRLRRQRTRREAKNLERAAKAGCNTPKVLRVDEKNYVIEMQYVRGRLLKDVMESESDIGCISSEVGQMLARLHDANLIHNDLTTSNLILSDAKVYIIDFGLAYHSTRLEDKAMDLVVFKKSIEATHTRLAQKIWENLLDGYKPDDQILKRVKVIEERVRYK